MTKQTKLCPFCGEEIKGVAIKCRYCGSMLNKAPTTASTSIQNPDTLIRQALGDKYEILGVIGKGGMAIVYKALQKNLNRKVALKVIHQNLAHDTEFVSRFIREAQVSASLNHPNIVTVHDVGSVGSVHYMAMELLEGEDLHQMVKQKGALYHTDVVKWMIPIAESLHYIHEKGLIHRDIKSSNILITKQGRPVLMDFGIAHAADGTKLTQTGTVIGTPEYMSPEQAQGHEIDNRSDLYSLGVVMYECLTGKVPFKGDNPLTTINLLINYEAEKPTKINAKIPDWLSNIVLKLLEKDVKQRFVSGKALASALQKQEEVSLLYAGGQTQKVNTTLKTGSNNKQATQVRNSTKNRGLKWAIAIVALFVVVLTAITLINKNKPISVEQVAKTEISGNGQQPAKQVQIQNEEENTKKEKATEYEKAGDYQMGKKNYKAALENYNKALKLLPDNPLLTAKKQDAEKAQQTFLVNEKRKVEETRRAKAEQLERERKEIESNSNRKNEINSSDKHVHRTSSRPVTTTTKIEGTLREGDSPMSNIISYIPKGATVNVIGNNGSYWQIIYRGKVGYLNEMYLNVTNSMGTIKGINANYSTESSIFRKDPKKVVTTTKIKGTLRESDSPMSNIISYIPKGATVNVIGNNESYWQITYRGKTGFLNEMYLNITYNMRLMKN